MPLSRSEAVIPYLVLLCQMSDLERLLLEKLQCGTTRDTTDRCGPHRGPCSAILP